MISYIIKDNNDILGVYKKLDDAYDFIIFINNYVNKKTNVNNIIKNIKIYKYKYNLIKKIYYINSKLKLIEEIQKFHSKTIQDNIDHDHDNDHDNDHDHDHDNDHDHESSEINIFIPNETEININIEDLKEKINLLEKLKQHENYNLQELKENYVNKEEKYIEEKIKIDNKKLKLKQEQEKWDSRKKKFEADKKLYYLFKQEIEEEIREKDDIPELFKDIYPIFEKLVNDGYLNTIQEINKYVELTNN
jgi:hypothetical protein